MAEHRSPGHGRPPLAGTGCRDLLRSRQTRLPSLCPPRGKMSRSVLAGVLGPTAAAPITIARFGDRDPASTFRGAHERRAKCIDVIICPGKG